MKVLATVRSDSNQSKTYEIREGKDGVVYCSCPSWAFGKGKPCKHLNRLQVARAA